MKPLGLVRGYKIGKSFLEFCVELREAGIKDIEKELKDYPDYLRRFNGHIRNIGVIIENGHYCTKLGVRLSSNFNKDIYDKGLNLYKDF